MPANYATSKASFPLNRDLPAEIAAALQDFIAADTSGFPLRASVSRPIGVAGLSDLNGNVNIGTDILTFSGLIGNNPVDLTSLDPGKLADLEVLAFNGISGKVVELGDFAGVVLLGRGNDSVSKSGLVGDVAVNAGDGRDTITTAGGDDTVNAGTGNDSVITGDGDDLVAAGAGWDVVRTGAGNDTVTGGDGNDRIFDTAGNNRMFGDAGNDSITTGTGADWISGGTGDDSISSGLGNDTVYTGGGTDTVIAGGGRDIIVLEGVEAGGAAVIDGGINPAGANNGDVLDLTMVAISSVAASGATGVLITLGNGATVQVDNVETFLYTDDPLTGDTASVTLTGFLAAFT